MAFWGRRLKWPVKWSQQNACRLTAKQEGIWFGSGLFVPLQQGGCCSVQWMGLFGKLYLLDGGSGFWGCTETSELSFVVTKGIPFCSSIFKNRVEEAWDTHALHSGHVVFSSAILNVVDHPEKGIARFGSCLQGICGCDVSIAPKSILARTLVLPVGNPLCVLFWPKLSLRLYADCCVLFWVMTVSQPAA